MDLPIVGFLGGYQQRDASRFHMPGHKGKGPLGCESWDITEVMGADELYAPSGIIAQAEAATAALFGAGRTLWSTEGSSQCVKAMLYLALTCRREGTAPVVLAARNVHKSFVFAAGLLDLQVEWLWPEESTSLCACPVTAKALEAALAAMETPPCAVYLTSPDYLGGIQDVRALARVAHKHGCLLLVDNAHGAYLHFLDTPRHPLDLGADLCCDSAHKTMPVLTGGAWLHIAKRCPKSMAARAKDAMALFGSTSPSYLTMASLDVCNAWMEGPGPGQIRAAAARMDKTKAALTALGWALAGEEPLKLTLDAAAVGLTGEALAGTLRDGGVEPEYVEAGYVVLMASAYTEEEAFEKVERALEEGPRAGLGPAPTEGLGDRGQPNGSGRPGQDGTVGQPSQSASRTAPPRGEPFGELVRAMSIRQAMLSPCEEVPLSRAAGRVCALPTVSCPPAIPVAVPGEVLDKAAVARMEALGMERCLVTRKVSG